MSPLKDTGNTGKCQVSIARYSILQSSEWTGSSWWERKCPDFKTVAKGGFEPWISRLRVQHSTAELPHSTSNVTLLSRCHPLPFFTVPVPFPSVYFFLSLSLVPLYVIILSLLCSSSFHALSFVAFAVFGKIHSHCVITCFSVHVNMTDCQISGRITRFPMLVIRLVYQTWCLFFPWSICRICVI